MEVDGTSVEVCGTPLDAALFPVDANPEENAVADDAEEDNAA